MVKHLQVGVMTTRTRLWNVATGQHKHTLTARTSIVNSVAFSPDGKTLASAGGELSLWDVVTGQHKGTLTGHTYWINSVVFMSGWQDACQFE